MVFVATTVQNLNQGQSMNFTLPSPAGRVAAIAFRLLEPGTVNQIAASYAPCLYVFRRKTLSLNGVNLGGAQFQSWEFSETFGVIEGIVTFYGFRVWYPVRTYLPPQATLQVWHEYA